MRTEYEILAREREAVARRKAEGPIWVRWARRLRSLIFLF